MDINLLSPDLLIVLGIIFGAAGASVLSFEVYRYRLPHPKAHKTRKPRPKWLTLLSRRQWLYVALVLGSVALALIISLIVHMEVQASELPARFWLMLLPFTTSIGLAVLLWIGTREWAKLGSGLLVVLGFVFTLTLVNSYYNFFPTLYSVFSADSRAILAEQNESTTTIQYSPSRLRDHHLRVRTVESSLFGLNASDNGKVFSFTAPGVESHFTPRTEWGYMPAIAANSKGKIRLPVIVLLPGSPGVVYGWLEHGLERTLNRFAAQHHGVTPYVFMVDDTGSLDNDTECVNSSRGNIETYLTVDLPNYIKKHYDVDTGAGSWGIGGLSMGGTCSVMLALRHPNTYSLFMDFSGEVGPEVGSKKTTIDQLFGGSEAAWQAHQPMYLLAHTPKKTLANMSGFFGVGAADSPEFLRGTKTLYAQARRYGLDSRFESVGGAHNWYAWEALFRTALPWASNRLGATD